jgi:hypothetical protein
MKHEQQPSATVLRERVTRAAAIDEIEVRCGRPDVAVAHDNHLLFFGAV